MTPAPGDRRSSLPGFVVRMVSWWVGADRREEVVADLEDSWARRRKRWGPVRSGLWLAREVGGLAIWRARETLRGLVPDLARDLRLALRSLTRRPAFSLTAIAVLGIGIGAATSVSTLVDRIFFERPDHVAEPDRLVRLYRAWTDGSAGGALGHADYRYFRENARRLSGLAAWSGSQPVAWSTADGERDQVEVSFVSPDYFDVLGVPLRAGRAFRDDEGAAPGEGRVVVLSEGFWRRVSGADPRILGSTVRLNGEAFTVVGVAPEGFHGVSPLEGSVEAWVPIALYGLLARAGDSAWWERLPNARSNWLQVVGRLAPGVTFDEARAELGALRDALDYENEPDDETLLVARQVLYTPNTARSLTSLTRMLAGAVAVVLLLALSNVTLLLLSRASGRAGELAVRAALGAGRGRLVRQLLAESVVLALAGGVVGVALAAAAGDLAGSLLPYRFAGSFAPDARIVAGAVGLSLLAAAAVGVLPALRATGARGPGVADVRGIGSRSRLRDVLVVAQVALSVVLVSGALLFIRSFAAASNQDLGFATADRLLVTADLRSAGIEADAGRVFIRTARERIAALPGVRGVATTRQVPFAGDWSTDFTPPPELFPGAPAGPLFIGLNAVSPDYFDVMEIPLVDGRPLGEEDRLGAPLAAVVNEHLAETLWPGERAVGRILPVDEERSYRVVGVARNAQYYELGEDPVAQLYLAVDQIRPSRVTFVVRSAADAPALAAPVQEVLRELQPALAFAEAQTLASVFEGVTARYRVSAALVGLFGVLALVLAATGLYGVVAFLVASRTREIGVRMALGADRTRVAGRVVRGALARAAVGVGVGLALALWARRFAESLVFGVGTLDLWTLGGGAALLMAVAALAAAGPARRATRIDPLEAMRVE